MGRTASRGMTMIASALVMLAAIPASAGTRYQAPWAEATSQTSCSSFRALVDIEAGTCDPQIFADPATGTVASIIKTTGTRYGHTVAFFTDEIPLTGSSSVAFRATVRVDDIRLVSAADSVSAMLWVMPNGCSCGVWSGEVKIAHAEHTPTPGATFALTAGLTEDPAWSSYRVMVELVSSATTAPLPFERTLRTTLTYTGLEVTGR